MKNMKKLVFGILALLVMVTNVNAEEKVVEVDTYENLKTCLLDADNVQTCKLTTNITGTPESGSFALLLSGKPKKILDVQGYTLKLSTAIYANGKLDITGTKEGKIIAPDKVDESFVMMLLQGGTSRVDNITIEASNVGQGGVIDIQGVNNSFTLGKDATLKGHYGIVIENYSDKIDKEAMGTVVDVYGTIDGFETGSMAMTIHGDITGTKHIISEEAPTINIYDGAHLIGVNGPGIFAAGYGIWNIKGGLIEGYDALSIKAGTFNISGGTLKASGDFVETPERNPSGAELAGAAIGIASRNTYDGNIKINITGPATVESRHGYAIFEGGVDEEYESQLLALKITDGKFIGGDEVESTAIKIESLDDIKENINVVGGTYSSNVKDLYPAEGYGQSKSGLVGKLHTITTPEKVENGTVTVNPNAVEGETVVIKVTANEGYIVKEVSVSGVKVTKNADGTYSFVMPNKDVTVTVNIELEPKEIVVEDKAQGDKEVTLSKETDEVLKDSLTNTTDKELQELLENNDVIVELQATEVEKESLAKAEIAKFENVVKEATVAEFFDLSILVKAEGEEIHYLKELSKPITLTIDLPKLPEVAEGYSRRYYIIREHDGVYEKLNATLENGKLSFATDKFSTYALAYVDEKIENPSTFDGIVSFVTLAITSLGLAGYSIKKYIRK